MYGLHLKFTLTNLHCLSDYPASGKLSKTCDQSQMRNNPKIRCVSEKLNQHHTVVVDMLHLFRTGQASVSSAEVANSRLSIQLH